jgi:uncharacterized protein
MPTLSVHRSILETVSLRLPPGADIRRELERLAKQENIGAGVILGAVGSLSQVCLRFTGQEKGEAIACKHEILTLSGLISSSGLHLHMSVANSQGECSGGHVAYGCVVFTTLELVIGLLSEVQFQRVLDEATGYPELQILPAPSNS